MQDVFCIFYTEFRLKKGDLRCWKSPLRNRQNRKPVSVLICHLSSQPTPWKRAGSPFTLAGVPVYLALLVLVPPPPYVAIRRRKLLPHGFTLTLAGGLFSVTAFIRLLPSVLSTAGRPSQSGLSSKSPILMKLSTPSRLRRQPRGAYGLHYVLTGDLTVAAASRLGR